ncbi:MAG: hypothetical protein VW498_03745 [Candidatus Thalassarchaeaceae archaeon]
MKPESSTRKNTKITAIALSMFVLMLGGTAAVSIGEFAVPSLEEENVELSVVDDMTSETTTLPFSEDNERKGFLGRVKSFFSSSMEDRHEKRMQAFENHAEKRISYLENMTLVIQFCMDDLNCSADSDILESMLNRTTERLNHITNIHENRTLPAFGMHTHRHGGHHDDDHDDDDDLEDNETARIEMIAQHLERLNATLTALEFCEENTGCEVSSEKITKVIEKVEERISDWQSCQDDGDCDDHEDMRGKGHDKGKKKGILKRMMGDKDRDNNGER